MSNYSTLLFLLLLCSPIRLQGQKLTEDGCKKVAVKLLKESHYNFDKAPEIKIVSSKNRVAYFNQANNTIYLEDKLIDICKSFGLDSINALSFILGHELDHYLNATSNNFVSHEVVQSKDHTMSAELQADHHGMFMAEQAGFNASKIYKSLLDKIYQDYHIKDCLAGYPCLEDRINISESLIDKVHQSHNIYNAAVSLMQLGEYDLAIGMLQQIKEYFPAPEVFYNLALAYLNDGLNHGLTNNFNIIIPLEPDGTLKMIKPKQLRSSEDDKKLAHIKFNQALQVVNEIKLNKDHHKLFMLKLYILLVLEKYQEIESLLKTLQIENDDVKLFVAILEKYKSNNNAKLKQIAHKSKNQNIKHYANLNLKEKVKRKSNEKVCQFLNALKLGELTTIPTKFGYDVLKCTSSIWVVFFNQNPVYCFRSQNNQNMKFEVGSYKCGNNAVYVENSKTLIQGSKL